MDPVGLLQQVYSIWSLIRDKLQTAKDNDELSQQLSQRIAALGPVLMDMRAGGKLPPTAGPVLQGLERALQRIDALISKLAGMNKISRIVQSSGLKDEFEKCQDDLCLSLNALQALTVSMVGDVGLRLEAISTDFRAMRVEQFAQLQEVLHNVKDGAKKDDITRMQDSLEAALNRLGVNLLGALTAVKQAADGDGKAATDPAQKKM